MPNQYLKGTIQIPSALLITDITKAYPMVVTFTVPPAGANTYIAGQLVRLNIPYTWGMLQANGLTGKVLGVNSTTMALDIDSTNFDAFVYLPNSVESPASLAPAGSRNLEYSNFTDQVPFQSLNNQGN